MKTLLLASLVAFVSSVSVSAQSMFDRVNDFDGDGRADYAVTRNENGLKIWHLWRSTAGYASVHWGVATDTVTAGDYDGDSRTDLAVTRLTDSSTSDWVFTTYYLSSATGSLGAVDVAALQVWGSSGISNEDYDGDGKTDPGVFMWHAIGAITYRRSSTGTTTGVSMDYWIVRTGDLTGDNSAEVVSHNPGTGETTVVQGANYSLRFGGHGDRWVAADFDGDNKGEIAIFRPSTGDWWWIKSSDGGIGFAHWGVNGDVPVPADYDGDGKTDLAVYRPGSPNGVYWVNGSAGSVQAFPWGVSGDNPVQY